MLSAALLLLSNSLFLSLRLTGNPGSFPRPLPPEEERACLERWAQGDLEARNRLVEHNLGDPGGMAAVEADLHQELDHMVYDDHIQCCVLGCTHYPLVSDTIEKLYPGLPLIDPAQQMAQELRAYLTRSDLLRNAGLPGRLDVFTTGDVDEYALRARQVGLDPVNSVSYYPPMSLD